ncbi:MAG: hypothetical protein M0R28_20980 [Pigmentiphaga sp.]|nr:hypothetical protein [Pigmentiphaga sp.]
MFENIARKPLVFSPGTPEAVQRILSDAVGIRSQRFRIHYGDAETGRDWLEEWNVEGYIGRSTGREQIPLLVYNRRSMGGPGILSANVVKIRTARGGVVLWQHPKYHLPRIQLRCDLSARLAWEVLTDGSVHAAFHTEADRTRWLRKMGVSMPAPHTESPEDTNRWECPFCGERDRFEGHDDKGFPGDECECEAQENGGECTCEVTLSQPLTIVRDPQDNFEEVYYDSFVGGGSGAEIGSYHRIDCRACGAEIWNSIGDALQEGAA